jgi:hypothetical protein
MGCGCEDPILERITPNLSPTSMLSRLVFPPFALQAALLLVAGALEARLAWLMPADHVPMNDEGLEVLPFFVFGLVGFVLFIPVHWLILWASRASHQSSGLFYLMITILVGLLGFLPHQAAPGLAVFFASCFAVMGLGDWAARAWCRRREQAEQRATDAFVQSRKQQLKTTSPL